MKFGLLPNPKGFYIVDKTKKTKLGLLFTFLGFVCILWGHLRRITIPWASLTSSTTHDLLAFVENHFLLKLACQHIARLTLHKVVFRMKSIMASTIERQCNSLKATLFLCVLVRNKELWDTRTCVKTDASCGEIVYLGGILTLVFCCP